MSNPISCAIQMGHKLIQATLGLVGSTPALVKETLPTQLNDLLTESENLFNRCVQRGEMIWEKRQANN